MWHSAEVLGQNFFFQCSEKEGSVSFYLYNLKEVWSEKSSISGIARRAKELNKRISYDIETVMKTITSTTPESLTLNTVEGGHDLELKYHVSGRPLKFVWNLTPLSVEEFQKLVTYPLFMSIHALSEQIKELKDIVRKKDQEIEQYKAEGAVLKRKTFGTTSFNDDTFSDRYKTSNDQTKGFLDISGKVKDLFPPTGLSDKDCSEKPKSIVSGSSFSFADKLKKSPLKSKKRKFFENRRLHMESIHRARKGTMEYQSSQSQTPPDELTGIFQSLDELNAKRLASTSS